MISVLRVVDPLLLLHAKQLLLLFIIQEVDVLQHYPQLLCLSRLLFLELKTMHCYRLFKLPFTTFSCLSNSTLFSSKINLSWSNSIFSLCTLTNIVYHSFFTSLAKKMPVQVADVLLATPSHATLAFSHLLPITCRFRRGCLHVYHIIFFLLTQSN